MHEDLDAYLNALPERPSARDVGKFVADRFEEDRAKVKALIESQLRDVRWTGVYPKMTATDLAQIDPAHVVVTPTGPKDRPASVRSSIPHLSGPILTPSSITKGGRRRPDGRQSSTNKPLVLITVGAFAAVAVVLVGVRLLGPSHAQPLQPAATVAPDSSAVPAASAAAPRAHLAHPRRPPRKRFDSPFT